MKKTISKVYVVEMVQLDQAKWLLSITKQGADFRYLLEREGTYARLLSVYQSVRTVQDIKRLAGRDFSG